ncbi:MAG: hypothetical protein QMD32_02355 [Smithellaceae bacterium]|nr:hypothetical protein [Smithellaceae bacterium]
MKRLPILFRSPDIFKAYFSHDVLRRQFDVFAFGLHSGATGKLKERIKELETKLRDADN